MSDSETIQESEIEICNGVFAIYKIIAENNEVMEVFNKFFYDIAINLVKCSISNI